MEKEYPNQTGRAKYVICTGQTARIKIDIMIKSVTLSARIPAQQSGQRLDQALANIFNEHSRARLQGWIREGKVLVDNQIVSQKHRVSGGEQIEIQAVHEPRNDWQAEEIPLEIIHEDDHLIVINKPAGLVVHPGAGNPQHTLLNALLHYCPALQFIPRAGIVHRLDKETTGLMVIAKTPEVHTRLVDAMQKHEIKRHYQALVRGELISGGVVDQPIGRHPARRVKMAVVRTGKPARTHYLVEERFPGFTLLRCRLESGRTHQIRVHMAHLKHPIVGDPVYGGRSVLPAACSQAVRLVIKNFKRQALHASNLELMHPVENRTINWQAPLPEDFTNLLQAIRSYE